MKTFGDNISVEVFGASHAPEIGCIIKGIRKGIKTDKSVIEHYLTLRRPEGDISTSRREEDEFVIESGIENGMTTGGDIRIVIPNRDTRSADYEAMRTVARPSHADYAAFLRYDGKNDTHGGGQFSGRMTAAIVAAGAFLMPALNEKGIFIGTHIKSISDVSDRDFCDHKEDIISLYNKRFAVLNEEKEEAMRQTIIDAKNSGDSVGGVLETAIIGIEGGIGDPIFGSFEGKISQIMFAIPAIKGIEFGAGFDISKMRGSEANDAFRIDGGRVYTVTNNNGGINGGITNGMPVIFRCAVKPTPTIAKEQQTVDFVKGEEVILKASGRHDPCIVHRARAVVDCAAALAVADMLAERDKL